MIVDHHADQRFVNRLGRLRRQWLWILEGAFVCAAAALVVSLFLPKVYRATTYILISESKIGEPSRDSNLQQMAMLPTFVPFLDNDALISESLKRFNLDRPPNKLTVDRFRRAYLDVVVPKSTRLLELRIEFPDARLAADLANDIAQGAVKFNDRLNATDTTASQEFLKKHLDQAADRLAQVSGQRLKIQEQARLEDREKELAVLLRERDTLYSRLEQLRMDLVQNETRSKSLEQALAVEPEIILLKKNVTSDRYLELATEKLNLAGTPLAVTEESINGIRESLRRDFLNVTVASASQKTGVEAATARLAEVNKEISELVLLLVALRSQIATVDHEYALSSEAIKNASREYEAASVTVSSKSQDMKQIAPAMAPERPIRPNLLINTLAGFLVGVLVFGGGALAMQSYRDVQRQGALEGRNDEEEVNVLTTHRN